MKIKKITWQNRRDFHAILECEHCGVESELKDGYDDSYYHNNVIPDMVCEKCGKKSSKEYKPLATKYEEGIVV